MDKSFRPLDCIILHEVGCQKLCVPLWLILAIIIPLKKNPMLTLPTPTRGSQAPQKIYTNLNDRRICFGAFNISTGPLLPSANVK